MKNIQAVFAMIAVLCCSTVASYAATIISTRIVPESSEIRRGTLFATIGGRERAIAKQVWKVWRIAGGSALVWSGEDGAGGYENEGQSLWRYDASSGQRRKLMAEVFMIEKVYEARTRSGQTALVVSMYDGGLGAPHIAVVHPRRGQVWRRMTARIAGIRNGHLAVADLRTDDIHNSDPDAISRIRPIRMLYFDLDNLLRRRIIRPGSR